MTVSFFGHGDIVLSNETEKRILTTAEELIKNGEKNFLFGGYGNFDAAAANAVNKLKQKYPFIHSTLVIPYLDRSYDTTAYDDTLYPPIESVPKRFAIIKRNEYMIDKSDIVVVFVKHAWGGAAKALIYAEKKSKTVINIA